MNNIKNFIAVFLTIALFVGLFVSRAVLSIFPVVSLLALIIFWFSELKSITKSSYMLWSTMPVIIGLFGIYKAPAEVDNLRYLLSMSNYVGIAAYTVIIASLKLKKLLTSSILWCSVILVIVGTFHLILSAINGNLLTMYSSAGTIKSLMHNDHVRLALFIALALALEIFNRTNFKFISIISIALAVFLVIYAVRTGWVALGIICIGAAYHFYRTTNNFGVVLKTAAIGIVSIVLLYIAVPSIKGKLRYQRYDSTVHRQTDSINDKYSDGTRFKINKAAKQLIFDRGVTGVGWHAVGDSLQASAMRLYKGKSSYRWPFSQILFWLLGGGYMAVIMYTIWMALAVKIVPRSNRLLAQVINAIFFASFFVESTLSLQLGIVLYALFMGLCFIENESVDNS
jgi:O-antigen ligase